MSGRAPAATAVKAVHTAIFGMVACCVGEVFVAGVLGRPRRRTWLALAVALTEGVIFLGNRGRCPLTGLAERLGAEHGRVTDIFLPRWFADRIPLFFTPPLVVGTVLLLCRRGAGR